MISPERLFLWVALPLGLLLVALVPPMGGGNEYYNFQRSAAVAYGGWLVEPVQVPQGLVSFLETGKTIFYQGRTLPMTFSQTEWQQLEAVPADAQRVMLMPNAISVLHPFAYLPQAAAIRLVVSMDGSPLVALYLARLAGCLVAVGLSWLAIRLMPTHRYGLCALALLPTAGFQRATLDADQLCNAMAFLFVATVCRIYQQTGPMSQRMGLLLLLSGWMLAQIKIVYALVSLLALMLPKRCFTHGRHWWLVGLIVPSLAGSVGWMLSLKQGLFVQLGYRNPNGLIVPEQQLDWVLHHLPQFAGVVFQTVFLTPFIPRMICELVGRLGPGPLLPVPILMGLLLLWMGVCVSDRSARPDCYGRYFKLAALILPVAVTGLILSLLYLQWTPLGAEVIAGFQGRYWYPVALLPLLLIGAQAKGLFGVALRWWLGCFMALSAGSLVYAVIVNYYASVVSL